MQTNKKLRSTRRQKISLKKYIALGVATSWSINAILNGTVSFFVGTVSAWQVNLLILVVACFMASFIAGNFFFGDHRRASTIEENHRYSIYTVLWSILLPAVLIFGALYLYAQYDEFTMKALTMILALFDGGVLFLIPIIAISLLIVAAIQYIILRWVFSWYTRRQSEKSRALT